MKVALINPPPRRVVERDDKCPTPSLSLAYIAAYLRTKDIDVFVIDSNFEGTNLDDLLKRLRQAQPAIVGLTAMTHSINRAAEVATAIKSILPKSIIVIGGVHATILPYKTLEQFPVFDIAVFGEGEYTFYEYVQAVNNRHSIEDIKGIAFRKGNAIQVNEPRERIEDLDALPFPAWDLFPRSKIYPLFTSRGCPSQCIFCTRLHGRKLRKRSPNNVVEELEYTIDNYHPDLVEINDETFTVDKKHAVAICDLILDRGLHKKVKWSAGSRVSGVTYELFRKMKEAGCVSIYFGVESGNEDMLRTMKKGITLDQAREAVRAAKQAGLETTSYFIIGHPNETKKMANETINFATELNTNHVSFGIMVPYPGTEVYEMATKGLGGYKLISDDWSDFNKQIGNSLELEHLSRSDLEKLQLKGYLKFYLYNLKIMGFIRLAISQRRLVLAYSKKFSLRVSKKMDDPK